MGATNSVIIVGAGLGGLCAGAHFKLAGIDDFVILERAEKIGGTWRENVYPGCAWDTPVALYQFSFFPTVSWSHLYPRAAEVQRYTEQVTEADDEVEMDRRPHRPSDESLETEPAEPRGGRVP